MRRSSAISGPVSCLALLAAFAFMLLLAVGVRSSQAAAVSADAVLLEQPGTVWDDTFNPEAMAAAFGTNWEMQDFGAVQADDGVGGLFAPHVRLIWIEGSDSGTSSAKAFVLAHEAQLKAFVARGGALFLNSATNEEIFIDYDGRSVGRATDGQASDEVEAVDPAHPIFKGPATPNATVFTGDSFAHGGVTGPGLTPVLIGKDSAETVLAEYASGAGRVMIGSLTAAEFQEPEAAAKSLRINLLSYLFAGSKAGTVPLPPLPPDTTKPGVKIKGLPKQCVEQGFRFRVEVTDASGVGTVRVKLGKALLRKVEGKGSPAKTVKVQVPDGKLTHSGRYRIKIIAGDTAGNVKRQGAGFRAC
jgi:hypothetical protein